MVDDECFEFEERYKRLRVNHLQAVELLRQGKRRDGWELLLLDFLVDNLADLEDLRLCGWPVGWHVEGCS